jgi:ketosteroid isomerase-like protein
VRTPQEVFQHHGSVLGAGDLEGIVSDYSEDAIFISPDGVLKGKAGIRKAFTKLLADLPSSKWELKQVYEGDVLFLEWSAESAKARTKDGIDTFIFKDGLIRVQTVRYTLERK